MTFVADPLAQRVIVYRGTRLENAYRMDLVVEDKLVVEVKAVEKILPVHKAQLLTYVRHVHATQGLFFNFNEARLKDGIRSVVLGGSVTSLSSDPSTDEKD
jgi:GxxExxY protein